MSTFKITQSEQRLELLKNGSIAIEIDDPSSESSNPVHTMFIRTGESRKLYEALKKIFDKENNVAENTSRARNNEKVSGRILTIPFVTNNIFRVVEVINSEVVKINGNDFRRDFFFQDNVNRLATSEEVEEWLKNGK